MRMNIQCEIYFRDLFLEVQENNLDIVSRTKEIDLHILGVLKYTEKAILTHLPSIGSAKLEEYHSQISEIEKRIK